MLGILSEWFLDPAALLFFVSIAVGIVLIVKSKPRLSNKSTRQDVPKGEHTGKKEGFISVRTFFVVGIWFVVYELVSAPIFVNPMVRLLERMHESDEQCAPSSHVVLLSGGVNSRARSIEDYERMTPATFVRATEASRIIANEPDAKLIVSGGVLYRVPEAGVIGHYLTSMGIPEANMILESSSTNTYENAVNVAAILAEEDVQGPIRLVSSAMHMHRAYKSFELALKDTDITICPVSVDAQGISRLLMKFGWVPQVTALTKFDHLLHELVALLVYRLKGWI